MLLLVSSPNGGFFLCEHTLADRVLLSLINKLAKEQVLIDGFKKHSELAKNKLTCESSERIYCYYSLNKELNRALEPYKCKVKLVPHIKLIRMGDDIDGKYGTD